MTQRIYSFCHRLWQLTIRLCERVWLMFVVDDVNQSFHRIRLD